MMWWYYCTIKTKTWSQQLELVEAAKKGELTGAQRELLATGQTYSPSTHRRVKKHQMIENHLPIYIFCMHALFFNYLLFFFKSRSDYWVLVDYILSSLELTLFFLSIVTTDHLDILVLENRDSLSNAYIIFLLYIEANHFPPLLPAF